LTSDEWESSSFRFRSQSNGGGMSDQNRLSPISANSTRYEQPPLFPFRSLRETVRQRMEMSQTRVQTNTENSITAHSSLTESSSKAIESQTDLHVTTSTTASTSGTSSTQEPSTDRIAEDNEDVGFIGKLYGHIDTSLSYFVHLLFMFIISVFGI
jgi:hypothetical protein